MELTAYALHHIDFTPIRPVESQSVDVLSTHAVKPAG